MRTKKAKNFGSSTLTLYSAQQRNVPRCYLTKSKNKVGKLLQQKIYKAEMEEPRNILNVEMLRHVPYGLEKRHC